MGPGWLAAQSFLHGVLHEYRDELGHARVLVPRCFVEDGRVHFVRAGSVGVLPRQLVSDPIEVFVEHLAMQFLAHGRLHWHLHQLPSGSLRATHERRSVMLPDPGTD